MEHIMKASPIFLRGEKNNNNVQAGFSKSIVINKEQATNMQIHVTACSFYRLYVNGTIVAHGPARAGYKYLRVDTVDISKYVNAGENIIAFEVTSHGDPFGSYSNEIVCKPGLLAAAIVANGELIEQTDSSWRGIRLYHRVQRAERISHCRQNAEIYYLDDKYYKWRTDPTECCHIVECFPWEYSLIPRGMAMPTLEHDDHKYLTDYGSAYIDRTKNVELPWFEAAHSLHYSQLEERPGKEFLQTVEKEIAPDDTFYIENDGTVKALIHEEGYLNFDFIDNRMGFIGIEFECDQAGTVDIVHLESYGYMDDKSHLSLQPNPVTRLHVMKGKTSFVTMEPALFRYIKLYFRGTGTFHLKRLYSLDYSFPDVGRGFFQCSDDDVNRLYRAARRTLKLNTLDIFMDCPERERGGWLCDSLWTARAACQMMGDLTVERAFIENFMEVDADTMWKSFFPEVFPGNKLNQTQCVSITTWSFWLMLELCEYAKRSADRAFIDKYAKRVEEFVNGSMTLIGQSGLIENLPCLFIDWSFSNSTEFCQPISTGANSLYAKMLCDLGELYGRKDWQEKGTAIRYLICGFLLENNGKRINSAQAMPDNLVYDNGALRSTGHSSEATQYLLLWSGLFDDLTDEAEIKLAKKMIRRVIENMGQDSMYPPSPRVGGANLFIGLCIRLDMLAKYGKHEMLLKEIKKMYGFQLKEGPGTFWEDLDMVGTSRCHGFNAHVGVHLTRDILGLGIPDEETKTIRIAPHPCGLRWARGIVATSDGMISLSWTNEDDELKIRLSLPDGWTACRD